MQKLSAELYNQIIGSLTSDHGIRIHEKREKPRVGLRSNLDVITRDMATGSFAPSQLSVRDISVDGLGMVSSIKFKVGTALIAEFDRRGNEPLRVMYQVTYCHPLAPGLFSVGAQMVRLESQTTLNQSPRRNAESTSAQ